MHSSKVLLTLPHQRSLETKLANAEARIKRLKLRDKLKREKRSLRHSQSRLGRLFYDTAIGALEEK